MKSVSRDAYLWGHLATIFFHIAIASTLIAIYFKESWSRRKIEILCISLGSVLLVVSILSMIPILNSIKGLQKIEFVD